MRVRVSPSAPLVFFSLTGFGRAARSLRITLLTIRTISRHPTILTLNSEQKTGCPESFHGVVGGIPSKLSGGSFSKSFWSTAIVQAFAPGIGGIDSKIGRVGAAALVGGIASTLVGGKFAVGAYLGAFSRWFNDEHGFAGVIRGTKEIFGAIKANSKALWNYYSGGGETNRFTESEWLEIKAGGINSSGDFNDHPTHSEVLGTATVDINAQGEATGVFDTYDFDPKPWGSRSRLGEVLTRTFEHLNVTADVLLRSIPIIEVHNPRQTYYNCYGTGC